MPDVSPIFGYRAWSFSPNDSSLSLLSMSSTDFFVTYAAQRNGDNVQLSVKLNAAWRYSDFTLTAGVTQRKVIEDFMSLITGVYVGQRGTLVTDPATGNARTLSGITFDTIEWSIDDSNQLLEYSVGFTYPLSNSGGAQLARTFQFGLNADGDKVAVSSLNLIVEYGRADATVFKPIFRANPVRVPSGNNVLTIKLRGVEERPTAAYGSSPLVFRQANEARIVTWLSNLARERKLYVDGVDLGLAHLRTVTPQVLDLPQGVMYELEFYQGYVN